MEAERGSPKNNLGPFCKLLRHKTEFRGKLARKTLKKQRLNKVRLCRKHCKHHSPRHILQKPLATRKTKPNRKIRQKGLEKPYQKNKKKTSISEQILTQKSCIFLNFRAPGPPEVLQMLLWVPFLQTLQIQTASGTHFSGFSWIWAPKLEAKRGSPKNNLRPNCTLLPVSYTHLTLPTIYSV